LVEEQIRTVGRGFGIFHELWHPYATIIERGLAASAADPSALPEEYVLRIFDRVPTHSMANRDQQYVNSFRDLLTFSPTVKAELAQGGSDKVRIRTLLDAARNDTKRSHASAVKNSIGDWHSFNPGLSKKPSSLTGWDHDECARLLCPPNIEWNDM